jgi:hypothetical protein
VDAPGWAEGLAAVPRAAWLSRPGCGLSGPVSSLDPHAARRDGRATQGESPGSGTQRCLGQPWEPGVVDAAPHQAGAGEWLLPSSASCWPPSWIWCCCFPRMHRGRPGGWSPRTSWSGGGAGGAERP